MKRFLFLLISILFCACINKNSKKEVKKNNLFYDIAFNYLDSGKVEHAFLYFNKAKDFFLQQEDSLGAGKCLVNMAIISEAKGDYFGSLEIGLNASSYFDKRKKNQFPYIKSNFNNLGITSHKLKDYQNALKFYKSAIKFSNDSSDTRTYLNNMANTYEELNKYSEALKIYNHIIKETIQIPKQYARVLTNISLTKWHQNSAYNAAPDYLEALRIRVKEEDFLGQNSSYAHLADYYTKKQPDSALIYAHRMYQVAKKINSPDDQLQALYKLVKLSPQKETKYYFEIYEKLDDSLQTSRRLAKNQFALIRYETEKHKADNLILQKDNTEKKYQLIKQKTILFSAITLLVLGSIFSVYWYSKRKKSLQKEKELEVKNTELKYVKKVHDRVANKVYNVMMEVENTDNFNKITLADKLESIYKISRDISYENNDLDTWQLFAQQLNQLLMSYTSDLIRIIVNGNDENLWQDADELVKSEIIIILQELMTNMMKHSQATAVQLDFKRVDNRINIVYLDNGIGIVGEPIFKNGLTNTGNRIEEINGVINFDITVQKGLKIEISFPVF